MSDRDEELDLLEQELRNPFVEIPDEINQAQGQTCFMDQDRLCMPDCTAFNIYEGAVAEGPERCTILVYLANSAVQHQELVQLMKKAATKPDRRVVEAIATAPIPNPYGGDR